MKQLVSFWLFLALLLGTGVARAQPVCDPSFPGTLPCLPQAVAPKLTDLVVATEQNGPDRNNQSVKLSISQILGLAGSSQYLPFSGGTLAGKLITAPSNTATAGFNLPQGAAPAAPINGDLWTTNAGLFVQINGSPFGPLGTGSGGGGSGGGSVNPGSLNALAYYAAAGTIISPLNTTPNALLQTDGSGTPSFSATGPAGLTFRNVTLQPTSYATASVLPPVTVANEGQEAFVLNCLNGTETDPNGSGCSYRVDNTGSWVPYPHIPTQAIGFGIQSLQLGQSAVMQGSGGAIATWSGGKTSGNLVSQSADGTLIDAGVAVTGGGGGGSGTVAAGVANQFAFYPSSTNAVAGLPSTNNAVATTDGSGVPGLRTTLPNGLNIPGPTISSPNFTGSGQYGTLTGIGKLNTAASTTTQAGFNVAPGVVPTAPANGDIWSTAAGFFMRVNGGTFPIGSGNGTLTGALTAGPLTGGGTSGTLTLNCPGCVTTTGGGALAVALPLQLNQTNSTLSIGNQTRTFTFNADQFTTVGNAIYTVYITFPYASGSITSIQASTGGTASSSFAVGVQVAGGNIPSCTALTVSLTQSVSANCGTNNIVLGNSVQLVISGVNGQPSSSQVQVNYSVSAS